MSGIRLTRGAEIAALIAWSQESGRRALRAAINRTSAFTPPTDDSIELGKVLADVENRRRANAELIAAMQEERTVQSATEKLAFEHCFAHHARPRHGRKGT